MTSVNRTVLRSLIVALCTVCTACSGSSPRESVGSVHQAFNDYGIFNLNAQSIAAGGTIGTMVARFQIPSWPIQVPTIRYGIGQFSLQGGPCGTLEEYAQFEGYPTYSWSLNVRWCQDPSCVNAQYGTYIPASVGDHIGFGAKRNAGEFPSMTLTANNVTTGQYTQLTTQGNSCNYGEAITAYEESEPNGNFNGFTNCSQVINPFTLTSIVLLDANNVLQSLQNNWNLDTGDCPFKASTGYTSMSVYQ